MKSTEERKRTFVDSNERIQAINQMKQLNEMYEEETNTTRKCMTLTYGCQMNERDSEILFGMLQEMGYEKTDIEDEADMILINTCCIREKAESKVLSYLGELRKWITDKPGRIIGVCGCMTQQEGMSSIIRQSAPHVQLIFGTHNIHQLPILVRDIFTTQQPQIQIWDKEEEVQENLPAHREYSFKALVNIIYGCNNFCTYCIVPYVRGRERSRRIENIVEEVKELVADGVVEIMLLGQNVNSYGKDFKDDTNFAKLLEALEEIEGLRRIRYMTSHPRDFTDELIATIAKSEKVVRHFHLPVQAGSSRVLKLMNRGYTKEEYLNLVEKIKTQVSGAALTTDIIVGFPGETEEDFQETIDLVKQVGFDNAYSFVYSKRIGTPAAKMEDPVSLEEKKERLQRLNKVLNANSKGINEGYLNKIVEVLVEGESKNNPEMLSGRTDTGKTVIFAGDSSLIGKFVDVKITEPQTWILKGTLQ